VKPASSSQANKAGAGSANTPTTFKRDPPPHLKAGSPVDTRKMPSSTLAKANVTAKPVAAKGADVVMANTSDDPLDSLTSQLTTLSLIPRTVHFGRGKSTGFGHK